MKWTYAIRHKLVAAFILTVVIGLVVISKFNEKRNADQIQSAINTIYNDRLMADHYIIQYLQHSHRITEALEDERLGESDRKARVFAILSQVKSLDRAYLQTKLTETEKTGFIKLSGEYIALEEAISHNDRVTATLQARNSIKTLAGLSDIQYLEARHQMTMIDKLHASTAVFFRFEVVVLLVIGLIIQALIFASKSMQVTLPENRSVLN